MNIAYNRSNSVVIILDNSITGMTGHQQNPTTGVTLQGDPTAAVDLEALCKAVGIAHVTVCDPYHMAQAQAAVQAALDFDGPAVVISRRPCVLLKSVKPKPALRVNETCVGCKACMKIGCPALTFAREKADPETAGAARQRGRARIDGTQCVGCGVCAQLCRFGAME
jgi:indolepyruvate ferredoxin oxidoreductase alpha subunit